jgi:error-prone DNA polymerase
MKVDVLGLGMLGCMRRAFDLLDKVAFLRGELKNRGFKACVDLRTAGNDSRLSIAGLVLVRQMPGSAKGVMFVTLEDESANANLIVWPSVFEANRRTILGATILGCRGKVQHASGVTHLVVEHVIDLSEQLKSISELDDAFPLHSRRGDDSRDRKVISRSRDMYESALHIDTLEVKARNFR